MAKTMKKLDSKLQKQQQGWAVDKSWNMEHPGTFRNIPEHRIIMIIMRKKRKIKFWAC